MQKRTAALGIEKTVKLKVAARDSVDGWPCCLWCGSPAPTRAPLAFSCAHYISRAQGGLGISQNILTLCPDCHRKYDGPERNTLRPILRRYLREHYDDWNEEDLIYKK